VALLLNQVVRVRVAVVLDTAASDSSVGQVYDEESAQWADLVWIDLLNSTAMPQEFGDVEFWAEVSSLAITRVAITRPGVRLRAWRSGGQKADEYEVITSGSSSANIAKVRFGGADVMTNLPGLGTVQNTVRVRGFRDQRVGWSGRMPAALSWELSTRAIRKRVKYGADASIDQDYLAGVSGFSASLGAFNAWLAGNLPEYGSALTVGACLEFSRTLTQANWTYRYQYVASFILHAVMSADSTTWAWTARRTVMSVISNELTSDVCGGRTNVPLFYGDAYLATAANQAFIGASTNGFSTGSFVTPAAGGGTVTASPRNSLYSGGPTYGVDIALTVTPKGRISNVAVTGLATSDGTLGSVTAWGACKAEGGWLA
jgi:hypothetical protein